MLPDLTRAEKGPQPGGGLNILVLYDHFSVYVNTIREHLESFALHSRHNIYYAHATNGAPLCFDVALFDVVIVHYCVRLAFSWHLSPEFAKALRAFNGPKLLFIQDEYDSPAIASAAIQDLGIEIVFSCVPPQYLRAFYPLLGDKVAFFHVLTGYVSPDLERIQPVPALSERKIVIGYRGRPLPYRYGLLCREKIYIGEKMRDICRARNIPHDIEWAEEKRIYGDGWYRFVASCRATLGVESGSNVIDRDGSVAVAIDWALKRKPSLTFEQVFEKFLRPLEGEVVMNQISPRVFEAIALRTALVLFEGTYSGVVQPDLHFIPLKKDFSNVDDVLRKVQDDRYLEELTERAYRDIILSRRYGYNTLVARLDEIVDQRVPAPRHSTLASQLRPCTGFLLGPNGPLSGLFTSPIDARRFAPIPLTTPPPPPPPPCPLPNYHPLVLREKMRVWGQNVRCRAHNLSVWLKYRYLPFAGTQLTRLGKICRIGALYCLQPAFRRVFHCYLRRRALRRSVSAGRLWQELLRLSLIKRIQQGQARIGEPFHLALRYRPSFRQLKLVSVPADGHKPGTPAAKAALDDDARAVSWDSVQRVLNRGEVAEILWDHSAIGTWAHDTWLFNIPVQYAFRQDGVYSFTGLVAVGKHSPAQAFRLLRSVLGRKAGPASSAKERRAA